MLNPAELAWKQGFSEPPSKWAPIVSPKPGHPVMAIIVDPTLTIIDTHYFMNRTVPCCANIARCNPCHAGIPIREKAYLAGWQRKLSRRVLIELTRTAIEESFAIPGALREFKRGYGITVERRGPARNAPLIFRLDAPKLPELELPDPFDVKATLAIIWGGTARKTPRW